VEEGDRQAGWACCTYDGGIATPLNPRLVYTAYRRAVSALGPSTRCPYRSPVTKATIILTSGSKAPLRR